MFKNILLAFDGSDYSIKAAKVAGGLAKNQKPQITLRILYVTSPASAELGEPYQSQITESKMLEAEKILNQAKVIVGDDVKVITQVLFGNPAESIIEVAEVRQCDLIVIGLRSYSTLTGLILGSQAQKVINHAPCPVLVVR
jgi:nucleotide-binding universal stress UspA family protein